MSLFCLTDKHCCCTHCSPFYPFTEMQCPGTSYLNKPQLLSQHDSKPCNVSIACNSKLAMFQMKAKCSVGPLHQICQYIAFHNSPRPLCFLPLLAPESVLLCVSSGGLSCCCRRRRRRLSLRSTSGCNRSNSRRGRLQWQVRAHQDTECLTFTVQLLFNVSAAFWDCSSWTEVEQDFEQKKNDFSQDGVSILNS